ncbi:MAG: Asp-tRNA(Asn)/Glu-tRNA(Gln) amidotransferase subunit GatC [Coriobacteriales bacterium]|jgi:aspartyl-tRNA(Asn)/glutamyl-tRNA(Gln) amidotransferase subunit C|nr:Asp-tRNA(Asn)/Glu-tRNA(Gln) amidotransferase subunit GatC [Coriobacteriales bacterium]
MYLTEKDVRGIATYARIGLTDDEVAAMTVDLNNIIESLKPITEYQLEGVEPTFHPIAGLSNVMREDSVQPGLSHDIALANAPDQQDGQFRIPSILGDGGGDR